jgi:hypothetical protein
MPFQRDGVQYGLARRGRVLIADEMGVGKTVQALALAACYQVGTCAPLYGPWSACLGPALGARKADVAGWPCSGARVIVCIASTTDSS